MSIKSVVVYRQIKTMNWYHGRRNLSPKTITEVASRQMEFHRVSDESNVICGCSLASHSIFLILLLFWFCLALLLRQGLTMSFRPA
jgi:hypothetical protein